jgi:putative membrane protein
MLDVLAYTMLGIGLGVFTGMVPGVHVNNLMPMFVALALSSAFSSVCLAAAIVAMSLAHTFISYIPSTFLGAPEEGTELSVLPAHRLLLEGDGYDAVRHTTLGCLSSLMLSAVIIWPLMLFIIPAYSIIQSQMHWLLIGILVIMIALERSIKSILWAALIFLLSGFLGLLALDTGMCSGSVALMPLLSGLFGISVLLPSMFSKNGLPKQKIKDEPIEFRSHVRPVFAGTAAGIFTGVIPSVGPSQGTVLAQLASRSKGAREFLVSVSGVNTSKALISFVTLYAIGRARSGAAIAVGQIMNIGLRELVFLVGVALFAGGIAAMIQLQLGKLAAKHMWRMPYRTICLAVIATIIGLTVWYAGLIGLPILATATAIGLLPAVARVKRTFCMGVIMFPCILYFAGVEDSVLSAFRL